jgi:hypothetical protein
MWARFHRNRYASTRRVPFARFKHRHVPSGPRWAAFRPIGLWFASRCTARGTVAVIAAASLGWTLDEGDSHG